MLSIKMGNDLKIKINKINYSIASALAIIRVTKTLWWWCTIGKILLAIFFSNGVPLCILSSSESSSILMNPKVSPEQSPAVKSKPKKKKKQSEINRFIQYFWSEGDNYWVPLWCPPFCKMYILPSKWN